MPACEEEKSASSTIQSNEKEVSAVTNEPGPSETAVPKSAIDVALELIAQAESEALEAARIAALNKPKPRGRPPLHRKSVDTDPATANVVVSEIRRSLALQKNNQCHESDTIGQDQQSILPKRNVFSFPAPVPDPIFKDHLELEAIPGNAQPNLEVSLFGEEGNVTEPEPAAFDKMVILNYGSADGRLEDDEEPTSASESNNQKGALSARKDLKFKENKKTDEEAAVVQRILEEVCPTTFRARSSSSGTANKECDEELSAATNSRKRKPYRKRARGRPKKIERDQQEYFPPSQKTGRPRGRPRKDGADPIPRSEKKSIEKKYSFYNGRNGTRPRRAASMIQDFLELYAKVDLADLEEVHARATTFVRMLIDEYAAASKDDSKKSPRKEEHKICSHEGALVNGDASKTKREIKGDAYDSDEDMDTHSLKQEEMDVSNTNGIGDDESGEEAGSSGEDMAEDYESNSDGNEDLVNNDNVVQRRPPRTLLPDDFIDAIPVIRGTALQPLPTTADSALR